MRRIDHKSFTPGQAGAYKSWMAMRNRCKSHPLYAGRVRICERWNDFYAFLEDMGERPEGKSLDRFPDNEGHYEPSNCRWATQKEQIENSKQVRGREKTTPAEADAIRQRFAQGESYKTLAKEFGRSQVTIHRIASGVRCGPKKPLTAQELAECTAAINAARYRSGRLKPTEFPPNQDSPT